MLDAMILLDRRKHHFTCAETTDDDDVGVVGGVHSSDRALREGDLEEASDALPDLDVELQERGC